MAKLSADEQKMLDELSAKRDAPDDDASTNFDGDVIVLRGSRADTLIDRLFGGGARSSSAPADPGKEKPPAKPKGKPDAAPAADAAGDDAPDDGDEDDPDGDDVDDPPAQPGHRYFGGNSRR